MTTNKAVLIINLYCGVLAKGVVARPISPLLCSNVRIKYAYYAYLESLINPDDMQKYKDFFTFDVAKQVYKIVEQAFNSFLEEVNIIY